MKAFLSNLPKIVEKKKGHFSFVKQKDFEGADLLPYQRKFLKGAFGSTDEVILKKSNLYQEITDAKKQLYEKLVEEDFFPKNPDKGKQKYIINETRRLVLWLDSRF